MSDAICLVVTVVSFFGLGWTSCGLWLMRRHKLIRRASDLYGRQADRTDLTDYRRAYWRGRAIGCLDGGLIFVGQSVEQVSADVAEAKP